MLVNLECVRLLNPWTFNWTRSPKDFSLVWLPGFFTLITTAMPGLSQAITWMSLCGIKSSAIMFKVSIVGSLRDREVACSASDRQGSNFESCVWRTVSSQSSHHPQEVLLAQLSLYVYKGGLKPDSFHFHLFIGLICILRSRLHVCLKRPALRSCRAR